jgi:Cu2+-exporting ATPase
MVGDGINDGPVLAAADASCAIAQGAAIAQASADLLLVNDSLGTLAGAVMVARRALKAVRENLAWAFAYNMTAIPLAAVGKVPPWVAAAGMSLSSVFVVLNATRSARATGAAMASAPS